MLLDKLYNLIVKAALIGLPFLGLTQVPENLILNPGFENIDTCLNRLSTFTSEYNSIKDFSMKHWRTIIKYSSPGYVSNCVNPTIGNPAFQPHTPYGLQNVRESGNNFLFLGNFQLNKDFVYRFFGSSNEEPHIFKESFTGTLSAPLIPGKTYYVEFFVNQVNINHSSSFSTIATDAFDIIMHDDTNYIPRAESPYIKQDDIVWSNPIGNIIEDTLNWVKLSGCFTAKGAQRYFTIGTFRDTTEINYIRYGEVTTSGTYGAAYYYDDFLIYQCDTCCPEEYPIEDYIQLNGNPVVAGEPPVFEVFLNPGHTADIKVFDAAGRIVYESKIQSSGQHQMPYGLATGVYVYALINNEDDIYSGKVVVK